MKLLLVAFLIIAAGCSQSVAQTAVPTSGTSTAAPATSPSGPAAANAVSVGVKDFSLDPGDLTIHGSTVSLVVKNSGPTVHNVTIRDGSGAILMGTRNLKEGESETISAPVPPGTYIIFCSLPGHESLGIKGTLVVAP